MNEEKFDERPYQIHLYAYDVSDNVQGGAVLWVTDIADMVTVATATAADTVQHSC